jgi:hypothetical protein
MSLERTGSLPPSAVDGRIDEHDVGVGVVHHVRRGPSGAGLADPEAVAPQVSAQRLGDGRVVAHEQEAERASGWRDALATDVQHGLSVRREVPPE